MHCRIQVKRFSTLKVRGGLSTFIVRGGFLPCIVEKRFSTLIVRGGVSTMHCRKEVFYSYSKKGVSTMHCRKEVFYSYSKRGVSTMHCKKEIFYSYSKRGFLPCVVEFYRGGFTVMGVLAFW